MTAIIEIKRALYIYIISIYKNPDTLQKSRQLPLRFYIKKARHVMVRNFNEIFEVGIYIQKA